MMTIHDDDADVTMWRWDEKNIKLGAVGPVVAHRNVDGAKKSDVILTT